MALESRENNHHKVEDDDSYCLSAMHLCCSQIYSAVLNAALELNLFEIIAKEGGRRVSASEVASKLPTSSQHKDLAFRIDRLLRLLSTHSLLNCSSRENEDGGSERVYAISPVGKYFVGGDDNGGFLALFSSFICHRALVNVWYFGREQGLRKKSQINETEIMLLHLLVTTKEFAGCDLDSSGSLSVFIDHD